MRKPRAELWAGGDPKLISLVSRFDNIEKALAELKGERYAFACAHNSMCLLSLLTVLRVCENIEKGRMTKEEAKDDLRYLFQGLNVEMCEFFGLDPKDISASSKSFDEVILDALNK